ncbi:helix-turn-helix transcriptional regulator [Mycolicibacter arupensis]|uniref:helix-turn-helix transcriptional regulator n=1 Tax=Mycolicibacter arupensis TaxID=342002 RepID=UPI0030B8ED5B
MEVISKPYLLRKQLADRWEMSPRTLENWAVEGKGPRFCRFGRRVLYRLEDVLAYEREVYGESASA